MLHKKLHALHAAWPRFQAEFSLFYKSFFVAVNCYSLGNGRKTMILTKYLHKIISIGVNSYSSVSTPTSIQGCRMISSRDSLLCGS